MPQTLTSTSAGVALLAHYVLIELGIGVLAFIALWNVKNTDYNTILLVYNIVAVVLGAVAFSFFMSRERKNADYITYASSSTWFAALMVTAHVVWETQVAGSEEFAPGSANGYYQTFIGFAIARFIFSAITTQYITKIAIVNNVRAQEELGKVMSAGDK